MKNSVLSLVFCTDCSNLLPANPSGEKDFLQCQVCGAHCKDTSDKVIYSKSKENAFPSALRAKRSQVQQLSEEDVNEEATIAVTCEKCGAEEVRFHTKQLRSADEGTTVFYTCPNCKHKWIMNN